MGDRLWLLLLLTAATVWQTICAFIAHELSDSELVHFFGTKDRLRLPDYYLDHPVRSTDGDKHLFTVNVANEKYQFDLNEHHSLLSPDFHHIVRYTNHSVYDHTLDRPCVWRGASSSHIGSRVSLVGCDEKLRGLISTADGEFYLINPVLDKHVHHVRRTRAAGRQSEGSHPHIIHKRDAPYKILNRHVKEIDDSDSLTHPCLFEAKDGPDAAISYRDTFLERLGVLPNVDSEPEFLAVHSGKPLVIELAVFADDAMWDHFRDIYDDRADAEMQKFILTASNNIDHLFDHSSLNPHVRLRIVRYEAMKTAPSMLRRSNHNNGEVDALLEKFCEYQNQINPASDSDSRHWDHALLFSGYDLYRGHLKSVAGYAPVKGMCSATRSCTINEGLDFGAVFVITHEMGHSLGMYHDGDNGCNARSHIMSPSVGSGKTSWSSCSVKEFNEFLTKLGTPLQARNCLEDGDVGRASIDHAREGKKPGQVYNLNQQCRIFHGDCWSHELRDGQSLSDVCEMVWCGGGEGIIRTSHPALEGTYCGTGRWCAEGKCVRWGSSAVPVVHGQWSVWDDSPSASCGADCSDCVVAGQMRVKRSIRLCESPAPNNGGRNCGGSNVRGLLCSKSKCSGSSPDEYATQQCTKLRTDADTPDLQLSGKGFQYEQSPCKVWCHMQTSGFIRTVGNFPDGTPCGASSYCVKGLCQKLACGGEAIVESVATDCPTSDAVQKATEQTQSTKNWAEWSSWTVCSTTCGNGVRQRVRSCQGRVCLGTSRQRESCITRNCGGEWTPWKPWSTCDEKCGLGKQQRTRSCRGSKCDGSAVQLRQCRGTDCSTSSLFSNTGGGSDQKWSTWGDWSECSRSCGDGVSIRRRSCQTRICTGRSSQSRSCEKRSCDSTGNKAEWETWSSWTTCTRSCGSGTRFRKRRCDGDGVCYGSSIEFGTCSRSPCSKVSPLNIFRRADDVPAADQENSVERESEWQSWQAWGACSASCGGGYRRRERQCSGRWGCAGPSSSTRSCNNIACSVFDNFVQAASSEAKPEDGWSEWSDWTACSVSCGRGVIMRKRTCTTDACEGSFRQLSYCVIAC